MAGQPKTRAKRAMESQVEYDGLENPGAADTTPPTPEPPRGGDRPPRATRAKSAGDRSRSTASGAGTTPDRRAPGLRKIHDGLTQTFMLAGLGVSLWDPFDGQVVALNAEKLASAWTDLAAQNATVKRNLERLLQGGAWGTAIGSTAMVAIPILVRHGFAPFDLAVMAAGNGVKIPDVGDPAPPPPDAFPQDPAPGQTTAPAAPAPPPESTVRHPMDGSLPPDGADLNGEPTIFPRSEPV